jgi:hypothetical protein
LKHTTGAMEVLHACCLLLPDCKPCWSSLRKSHPRP